MQLKAGMFGKVKFTPKFSGAAIVVPRESLVGSITNAALYVVADNVAKLRPVVVGKEIETNIEILKGLNEGEQVVVNGQNNLSDNAPVIVRK